MDKLLSYFLSRYSRYNKYPLITMYTLNDNVINRVTPKAINKFNGVSIKAAQLKATKHNTLSAKYIHLLSLSFLYSQKSIQKTNTYKIFNVIIPANLFITINNIQLILNKLCTLYNSNTINFLTNTIKYPR